MYDLVSAKLDTRPNLSLGLEPDADPNFVSTSDLDRWVLHPWHLSKTAYKTETALLRSGASKF